MSPKEKKPSSYQSCGSFTAVQKPFPTSSASVWLTAGLKGASLSFGAICNLTEHILSLCFFQNHTWFYYVTFLFTLHLWVKIIFPNRELADPPQMPQEHRQMAISVTDTATPCVCARENRSSKYGVRQMRHVDRHDASTLACGIVWACHQDYHI